MRKLYPFLFLLSLSGLAQQPPAMVTYATSVNSFVPGGWKIIASAKGDLNKDGTEDIAIVIEDTKKENFMANNGAGEPVLNNNPRTLLVLFRHKTDRSYSTAIKQDAFIAGANSQEIPCLNDPLSEDWGGGISIDNGYLYIDLHYYQECNWAIDATLDNYKFKWQDNSFVLINYNTYQSSNINAELNGNCIDFLTHKREVITGDNKFGDFAANKKTIIVDIKVDRLLKLDELDPKSKIDF